MENHFSNELVNEMSRDMCFFESCQAEGRCYELNCETTWKATALLRKGWVKQKHGSWRVEDDREEPNPMFKQVVCSICECKANTTYSYCPNCGAKMI